MKIYLSPSMQEANVYSYGNTNEEEQCSKIAEACETHFKRNGYDVKRAPKGQSMEKNIEESNSYKADLHIAIHTNAGGGKGPMVMVYSKAASNLKYADPVYDALEDNSYSGDGYGVRVGSDICGYMPAELKDTVAIALYCECEFHDNKTTAKWITENTDSIAQAIVKGVCKADGKAYTLPSKTQKLYTVQVGAFAKEENAKARLDEAKKAGFKDAFIKITTV